MTVNNMVLSIRAVWLTLLIRTVIAVGSDSRSSVWTRFTKILNGNLSHPPLSVSSHGDNQFLQFVPSGRRISTEISLDNSHHNSVDDFRKNNRYTLPPDRTISSSIVLKDRDNTFDNFTYSPAVSESRNTDVTSKLIAYNGIIRNSENAISASPSHVTVTQSIQNPSDPTQPPKSKIGHRTTLKASTRREEEDEDDDDEDDEEEDDDDEEEEEEDDDDDDDGGITSSLEGDDDDDEDEEDEVEESDTGSVEDQGKEDEDEDGYEDSTSTPLRHKKKEKKKKDKKKKKKKKGSYKHMKKLKKYMLPLLIAYKLKFFTLIPLLLGGLVLIVGTTGFAGFFFALFALGLGLQKH